jgi:hypothetical protein
MHDGNSCCRNIASEEKVETAQFPRERKSSDQKSENNNLK